MRTLLLTLFFTSSALSQGAYLSRENAFSASSFYGRYDTDSKLGFAVAYSIQGFFDVSFARSSILTEEDISNFQNEYFIRGYLFRENSFFFSGGLGYLYQETRIELWRDFPLHSTSKGIIYEGALHFAPGDEKTRRVVISVSYRYSEPTTELRMPTVVINESNPARSFILDIAVVQHVGRVGLVIGPKVVLDHDSKNVFWGLSFAAMIRH